MSNYLDILRESEKIIYQGRASFVSFIVPSSIIGIAGLLSVNMELTLISKVLCALVIIVAGIGFLRKMAFDFTVTTDRVVVTSGVLQKDIIDLSLENVARVEVVKGVFGEIYNCGTILMWYADGTPQTIEYLHDPYEIRDAIQEQLNRNLREKISKY